MSDPPLEFTGERFTPECVREIWYEHWHRYAFALPLARGRRVLDAACGEGYGSALLARDAPPACWAWIFRTRRWRMPARATPGGPNLAFERADAPRCTRCRTRPST